MQSQTARVVAMSVDEAYVLSPATPKAAPKPPPPLRPGVRAELVDAPTKSPTIPPGLPEWRAVDAEHESSWWRDEAKKMMKRKGLKLPRVVLLDLDKTTWIETCDEKMRSPVRRDKNSPSRASLITPETP